MKTGQINMAGDPAFQSLLRQVVEDKIPFCKMLGMKLRISDALQPEIGMAMHSSLLGNFMQGMLHGGAIATLLDTVAGIAVLMEVVKKSSHTDPIACITEFSRISTIDLRVDYLRPGRGEEFIATAEVTRLGRRVANVLMQLTNEQGEKIATGAGAFMVHGS